MDEVGAKVQVDIEFPKEIEDLRNKLQSLKSEKVQVVKSQRYEKAAELRDQERNVIDRLEDKKVAWEIEMEEKRVAVTEEDIPDEYRDLVQEYYRVLSENQESESPTQ